MQLYVDLDGVLCDFDAGFRALFGREKCDSGPEEDADWLRVRGSKDFYANLPPMPDLQELWEGIAPFKPIILTGVPRHESVPDAPANKRAWVSRHLNGVEVICCLSSEKSKHCQPGDILIDDYEKWKHLWVKAGGIWITHKSARQTLIEVTFHQLLQRQEVRIVF